MVTQPEVLTRIEALFRLGEHSTSNLHEAANAIALAQALLLQHNLTRANINTNGAGVPTTEAIGQVQIKNTVGHAWRMRLAATIARTNLCMVVNDASNKTAHLFGTQTNVLAVVQMFDWLARELEHQAIRDWKAYKADGGTEASRTWRTAFYDGATAALRTRLEKPKEEFASTSAGSAIVLANDTRVKLARDRVFPYLTTGRRSVRSGSDGYGTGRQAGSNVRFEPQGALAGGARALGPGR